MKSVRAFSIIAILLLTVLVGCGPRVRVYPDRGPRYGYYGPRPYYRPAPRVIVVKPHPRFYRPHRHYGPGPRYYGKRWDHPGRGRGRRW